MLTDDVRLALVRLRAAQWPSGVHVKLEGPLLKKGHKGTRASAGLRQEIAASAAQFFWQRPPRAKVAVELFFFGISDASPSLHHLVKYYLDLLNDIAYRDDRQVHLLEAHSWKSNHDPHVYLKFERLSSVHRRLRLAREFIELAEMEFEEQDLAFESFVSPFADELTRAQVHLLKASKIQSHESTLRLPSWLKPMAEKLRSVDPLSFRVGSLPQPGQGDEYRVMLDTAIADFRNRWTVFEKVTTSIELNVGVTGQGLRIGKDLDNVMMDVYPRIARYLGETGEITGYRAYVADNLGDDSPGDLWVKILPSAAIHASHQKVKATLEAAVEKLDYP